MFKAALNTRYMHTDDVYIGILIEQLETVAINAKSESSLSIAAPNEILLPNLALYWHTSSIVFYHVPHTGIYAYWASEEDYLID